jgi:pilus assembly protein Flp/PilA
LSGATPGPIDRVRHLPSRSGSIPGRGRVADQPEPQRIRWAFINKEGLGPMALIHQFLASFRKDEEGQGLAEYALILALIAIVAIIALIFLGGQVSSILSTVGNSV